jgi:NAD(P)-dependent dehydrogenase (short-subunit alcohol dehydrogenase family)
MSKRPVAFITGAGRGIGRSIALELAGGGFDIVGCDIASLPDDTNAGLAEVQAQVEALGAAFESAPGDISRLETHEGLLEIALKRFKRIDVLVNNAGIAPERRLDILETTPESFDRVLSVNTRGAFFLTQRFARHMAAQKRHLDGTDPVIIFISSVSVYMSSPNRAEYCISKAAISHAARLFAHRLAEYGIAVFDVQPGIIETDMTAPAKEKYDALIREGLIPQGRWGRPEDVARAVSALAQGNFGYSTGLIVDVSGGMHIQRL